MRPATLSVLCQSRTNLALMFQMLVQGMSQGWSSPGVSKLEDGEGPFVPTTDEVSWIVSLIEIGFMIGSLLSCFVFIRAGRRQTLVVAPLAYIVWIALTYWATTPAYLYAARVFAGIGMGVNYTFSSIYIGEVVTPVMRSMLILVMTLLDPLGHLICLVIAPYLTYWQEALSPAPLVVLAIICTCIWTQETPYYLTMLGRHDDALRELTRLRRGTPVSQIQHEAAEIQRSVKEQLEDAATWRETFSPPGTKRAAVVVLVLCGSPALYGSNVVLSYTQMIFKESGSVFSKSISSECVLAVKVLTVVIAMYLIEKVGRRPQTNLTAFANSLSMAAMSLYFLGKEHLNWSLVHVKWIPLVALMSFMAGTGVGVYSVGHIIIGELLSQRAKKIVAPVTTVFFALTSFLISKFFPIVGDSSIGYCVPFGFFSVMSLLVAIFTVLFLPETKGKTLVEVQDELSKGKWGSQSSLSKLIV